MNSFCKLWTGALSLLIYSTNVVAQGTEILPVKHYDGLSSSLSSSVSSKLNPAKTDNGAYRSFYATNNGSISMKSLKNGSASTKYATTAFENMYSINASDLEGPQNKSTMYELLTQTSKEKTADKEYFSEIGFLDSNTVVTISYTKKNAYLLLIDVGGSTMYVTSRISVPVSNIYCEHTAAANVREVFYIDEAQHMIILPVNKGMETETEGVLGWKKSKKCTPGIWVVIPRKNEDRRWIIDPSRIAVNYFEADAIKQKCFKILTAHPDNSGNIWMSFSNGIVGVLPEKDPSKVLLANFNKDAAWYNDMTRNYKTTLYKNIQGNLEEMSDSINLWKGVSKSPQSYNGQYLENARYTLYSNLLKEKNAALDSNDYFENPETLWKDVHLSLDNPLSKKKAKTTDYFGWKVKQFQTIHNNITSGSDNSVYFMTNLGIHKLSFNEKTNTIVTDWAMAYKNSFLTSPEMKTATSLTTPVFMDDRNEIAFCDNDFPQINLLVLDAKTGAPKQQFSLFEYSSGSECNNGISYSNNTMIVANTFGNSSLLKITSENPSCGIMKFTALDNNNIWRSSYSWNKLQYKTVANTASPKIASTDDNMYIYHQPTGTTGFQVSAISLSKANKINPVMYALKPDFKGVVKANLNNFKSNYTFGPKKSILIGTVNGLLRIMSE